MYKALVNKLYMLTLSISSIYIFFLEYFITTCFPHTNHNSEFKIYRAGCVARVVKYSPITYEALDLIDPQHCKKPGMMAHHYNLSTWDQEFKLILGFRVTQRPATARHTEH